MLTMGIGVGIGRLAVLIIGPPILAETARSLRPKGTTCLLGEQLTVMIKSTNNGKYLMEGKSRKINLDYGF